MITAIFPEGDIAMKKIFCALSIIAILATCAYASVIMTAKVGFLTRLNTTEEEFSRIIQDSTSVKGWNLLSNRHELYGVKFYDSLTAMLMALDKQEIDEIALPEIVAEYIINENPAYEICCMSQMRGPMSLAFGFRKESIALTEKFSRVIRELEDDWTLPELQGIYIYSREKSKPVEFAVYDGADTVRVAVTGDIPPIDYISAEGRASGFNVALLAEIGRRLKVNIELVDIDAGARNTALMSGRVDVVFWYETAKNHAWDLDTPEGVILSEPYFSWNKFMHIRKK